MNKHWEDTNRELTDAAIATAAVVIVVATIVTAGAAAAAAGAAAGATAAGASATVAAGATAAGASAAAGATMAAAVTVGASTTLAATVATMTQAAILATLSTAAVTVGTTAMNASMNADGDMWKQAKGISKTTWDESTSRDAFESYVIAAATAALTAGATSGLDSATNSAVAANNAGNATLSQKILVSLADSNIASAIAESAISTTASTAAQSAINGESFGDALENQAENILIGAVANLGAKAIGNVAHGSIDPQTGKIIPASISKPTQLALHAGLGCGVAAAGGGDCASGAVSGVIGELAGEALYGETRFNEDGTLTYSRTGMDKNTAKELAGLAGGYSAIFTGNAVGLSDSEVADNIYSGQRIGKNAAENNALINIGGAFVGGTFGAIGAASGSYMDGERDPWKIGKAALVGGGIGAVSGALLNPQGVAAGIATGVAAGSLGGGSGNAITTMWTDPNASAEQITNSFVSGAFTGAIAGGFGAPIAVIGGTTAAGFVGAQIGLGAGLVSSAINIQHGLFKIEKSPITIGIITTPE